MLIYNFLLNLAIKRDMTTAQKIDMNLINKKYISFKGQLIRQHR